MKIAYIAHPIGAVDPTGAEDANLQVIRNINKVLEIVAYISTTEANVVPFAPYLVDCLALNDNDPVQRSRGLANGGEIIRRGFIDEVRLYGNRISSGMAAEIGLARSMGIPVVPCTSETTIAYFNTSYQDVQTNG